MALEGVGLGLALLAELTKTIKSMQERNVCDREGPILFGQVDGTLARLSEFSNKLAEILSNNPQVLPQTVLPDFVATPETVKNSLQEAADALMVYCSKAFFGNSSSSCIREFANKGKCFFKAKSLSAIMTSIQRETCDAENMLQHLFTHLGMALKSDDLKVRHRRSCLSEGNV